MNFLFSKNIKYTSFESVDDVQLKLEGLIKRKWYNISNNLMGKKKTDGSYLFYSKWRLIGFSTLVANAYLTVKLNEKTTETIIIGTLRPSLILVLALYILVIWFLYELINNNSSSFPLDLTIVFFTVFSSLLLIFIRISTSNLKKSFERFLGLN